MTRTFSKVLSIVRRYELLKELYHRHGYVFFDKGDYNINLFAVRNLTSENQEDVFDDAIGIAYLVKGKPQVFVEEGTTTPGLSFLRSPLYPGGAAAVVEGQYRRLWRAGTFRNTPALIQVGRVRLFRDNNKDSKYDFDYSSIQEYGPEAGIFFHQHFQLREVADRVQNSSAGCIVPRKKSFCNFVVERVKDQGKASMGETVTFTLFTSDQVLSMDDIII